VKERHCTNPEWCILFLVSIVVFFIVSFQGAAYGNPTKLIYPRDFKGQYCGIKEQWNDGDDLEKFEKALYTLNISETVDPLAETMICSKVMGDILVNNNVVTQTVYNSACPTRDLSKSFNQVLTGATDGMASFFSNPQDLLTGSGGSSSILSSVTKYFHSACVTDCGLTSTDATQKIVYTPAGDRTYYSVWQSMTTYCSCTTGCTSAQNQCRTLLNQFNLSVLPTDKCPYTDRNKCVVIPKIKFTELSSGYCTPTIDSGLLSSVGDKMSDYLSDLAKTSIATDIAGGFDSAVGDIQDTWDVFIIVGFISFVCGLVYLILLRFLVKPVVYLSILLVLIIFVLGGTVAYVYSGMCADSEFSDSASDLSTQVTGSDAQDCGGLYEVEDKTARDVLMVSAFVIWALGGLYCLAICCLWSRIKLAIAINEVAAMFVVHTPHIILVPIIQALIGIIWCGIWMFLAAFLLSQVPDDYVPTGSFKTYAEAYGTDDTAGKCTDSYPAGFVWKDADGSDCITKGECWKCAPPRYMFDQRFAFSFFCFLWDNAFFVACGQCIIAGAVGVWFFLPEDKKGEAGSAKSGVCTAVYNVFRYHPGSMAFGAFILAVVQFLKYLMQYLAKQAEAQKNKACACILKCLAYCLWCFEKCIKFLNKNAYIQVALMSTPFCESAKNAFFLILRNAARFGVMGSLGTVIRFIGKAFVIATTAILGLLVLQGMKPDVQTPVVLVLCYAFIGWFVGSLFMNVFGLAVDSTLQCFIATEEMKIDKAFIPDGLKKFIADSEKEAEGKEGCCMGFCSCCCD